MYTLIQMMLKSVNHSFHSILLRKARWLCNQGLSLDYISSQVTIAEALRVAFAITKFFWHLFLCEKVDCNKMALHSIMVIVRIC